VRVNGRNLADWGRGPVPLPRGSGDAGRSTLRGTIEDNISFFDSEHDPARVRECARAAMIDEEIMAMPMQYNTIVGSLGMALSGGQKQRVLLARALYRIPKILFLDEAFDQIDVALERRISTAIAERSVALVIVSHRPETVASSVKRMDMQPNLTVTTSTLHAND
jgi:ATP-binding cassette subfamily B protein RaxB